MKNSVKKRDWSCSRTGYDNQTGVEFFPYRDPGADEELVPGINMAVGKKEIRLRVVIVKSEIWTHLETGIFRFSFTLGAGFD